MTPYDPNKMIHRNPFEEERRPNFNDSPLREELIKQMREFPKVFGRDTYGPGQLSYEIAQLIKKLELSYNPNLRKYSGSVTMCNKTYIFDITLDTISQVRSIEHFRFIVLNLYQECIHNILSELLNERK